MYSLTRSARSTGPLVVLVAFSVVFATTWSHDQPRSGAMVAEFARREPTVIGDPAPPAAVAAVPTLRKSSSIPSPTSRLASGLRSATGAWKSHHGLLRAGMVGSQLGARKFVAFAKSSCFTSGAAFLCGTIRHNDSEDEPRTAGAEDDSQWVLK